MFSLNTDRQKKPRKSQPQQIVVYYVNNIRPKKERQPAIDICLP